MRNDLGSLISLNIPVALAANSGDRCERWQYLAINRESVEQPTWPLAYLQSWQSQDLRRPRLAASTRILSCGH